MSDQQKILGYMIAKQDEPMDVAAFAKALGMSNKDFICGLLWLVSEGDLRVSMKGDLIQDILNECGEENAIAFFNKISFVKTEQPPKSNTWIGNSSGRDLCSESASAVGSTIFSPVSGGRSIGSGSGGGGFPVSHATVNMPKSQWQPMGTAPKDGTKIFCINPNWDLPKVLAWKTNSRIAQDHERGLCRDFLASYFGYPDDTDDYEFADFTNANRPAAWMPIPSYPRFIVAESNFSPQQD